MTEVTPKANEETTSTANQSMDTRHWVIAMLISGLVAWVGYTYPPVTWRVPDQYADVGPLSSQEEQAEVAAIENANHWKNSILKFSIAGLGLGVFALVHDIRHLGKRWWAVLVTLMAGLLGGLLAAVVGMVVRRYFNQGYSIPLIGESIRPLVCDSLVLSIVSLLLVVPVSVFLCIQPVRSVRQKATVVPLAGVLTGVLVPVLASMVFPAAATNLFPPSGIGFTALWFVVLVGVTLTVVLFAGDKRTKRAAVAEAGIN